MRSGLRFDGEAGAADLPRLAQALAGAADAEASQAGGADWPASYSLRFGKDASGRAVVTGRVRLTLRPVCQRCLGEVAIPVDAPVALGLVRGDAEADALPDALDPLPVGPETAATPIRPLDLVEDELLLLLPQVPMHTLGACPAEVAEVVPSQRPSPGLRGVPTEGSAPAEGRSADVSSERESRENPFAVLARLKPRRTPDDGSAGEDS